MKDKKTVPWIVTFFGGIVIGALMIAWFLAHLEEQSLGEAIFTTFCFILFLYAAIFVQLIVHEVGHLIFGLATGYKFCSFRILNFIWIKKNDKIRLNRFTVPGTAGQCIMEPPDFADGKFPVLLYGFGGVLMNILTGFVFLILYIVFRDAALFSVAMLSLSVMGFILAITNGIPMRGMIDNDGYNAVSLAQSRDALFSFWVQLAVSSQYAKEVQLKDMPDKWFTVPSAAEMKNSMVAARGVLACSRLMSMREFEKAYELMAWLLELDSGMSELHRNAMICDCLYCELIGQNRREVLARMLTDKYKKFAQSAQFSTSVLRTEYAYALLCEKNQKKAEYLKARFEACAKKYPYLNDIQSERELMEIAAHK